MDDLKTLQPAMARGMVERIILRRFEQISDPMPEGREWIQSAAGRIADAIGGAGYSWAQQRDRAAAIIADEVIKEGGKIEPMGVGDAVQDRRSGEFGVIESIDLADPTVIKVWYHAGGRIITRRKAWARIGPALFWPDGTKIERNPNA